MEIFLLITVVIAGWFWFDSVTTRDLAVNAGRDLAERCNLQLLDETVACSKLWLGRNSRGHVQLMRTYDFEVSANGSDRMSCQLILLGNQLQTWYIPPYLQPMH